MTHLLPEQPLISHEDGNAEKECDHAQTHVVLLTQKGSWGKLIHKLTSKGQRTRRSELYLTDIIAQLVLTHNKTCFKVRSKHPTGT